MLSSWFFSKKNKNRDPYTKSSEKNFSPLELSHRLAFRKGKQANTSGDPIFLDYKHTEVDPKNQETRQRLLEMGIILSPAERKYWLQHFALQVGEIRMRAESEGRIITRGSPESFEIARLVAQFETWRDQRRREKRPKVK